MWTEILYPMESKKFHFSIIRLPEKIMQPVWMTLQMKTSTLPINTMTIPFDIYATILTVLKNELIWIKSQNIVT